MEQKLVTHLQHLMKKKHNQANAKLTLHCRKRDEMRKKLNIFRRVDP